MLIFVLEIHRKRLVSLADELKSLEIHDKRRNEVCIETEKNFAKTRVDKDQLALEFEKCHHEKMEVQKLYSNVLEEKT